MSWVSVLVLVLCCHREVFEQLKGLLIWLVKVTKCDAVMIQRALRLELRAY